MNLKKIAEAMGVRTYPEAQWECVLRPGAYVLSMHLPKGMDISPENVTETFRTVTETARQRYPDYQISGIYCGS